MNNSKKKTGIALATALVLLLVALPVSIFTYKLANQALKQSVFQAQKQSAVQDAISGIQDWMRMFTDDPMASSRMSTDDLTRSLYNMGNNRHIEFSFEDKREEDRSILVRATGKFGADPDHPDAQQTISALIRFQSPLSTAFGDYRGINGIEHFKPESENAQYGGVFLVEHLHINKSGVEFNGGPVYVTKHAHITGSGSSPRPKVHGDLYVGSHHGTVHNDFTDADVDGNIYYFIPKLPTVKIDLSAYRDIANWTTTSPTAIYLAGDGTFQEVTDDALDDYVKQHASHKPVPNPIPLGAPQSIPSTGGIFLADQTNIGVWGTVNPRITIVATGRNHHEGNIVICDDIWYVGGSSKALTNSSIAFLAGNQVWFKRFTYGDSSVRGVFFQEKQHHMKTGHNDKEADFYLSGTRNARIHMHGHAYKDGQFIQEYDENLRKFPPPGLPEWPMMVDFNIN